MCAGRLSDWFRPDPVPNGFVLTLTADPDPVTRANPRRHPEQRRRGPLERLARDRGWATPCPTPPVSASPGSRSPASRASAVPPGNAGRRSRAPGRARSRPPVLTALRDGHWLGGLECRVAGRCDVDELTEQVDPGHQGYEQAHRDPGEHRDDRTSSDQHGTQNGTLAVLGSSSMCACPGLDGSPA